MFENLKVKIEELKAEIEGHLVKEEVKADGEAIELFQGWTDALVALKKRLEEKENPAPVEAPPEEPAQDVKGDASEPEAQP